MTSLLEYRFGFFGHLDGSCSEYGRAIFLSKWVQKKYRNLNLFVHPQTPIKHIEGNGKTVLVVGTIYSVAQASLDEILGQMLNDDADSLGRYLDDVSGRFALFYDDGHSWRVYHDAFGSRSMFYSPEYGGVVASHSGLLADVFGLSVNEATMNFIRSPIFKARTVKYLPGDLTGWRRVYAVIPNNYLALETSKLHRYWPVEPKKNTTYEDFFFEFDRHIKGLLDDIKKRFLIVGITGGIDSRTVFSAMLKYGIPFNGVTWLGGYIDKKELGTVEEIVKAFHISHKNISMNDDYSSQIAMLAAENSGKYREPSKLVARMERQYGTADGVFVRGYGGEIIRGFYNTLNKPMDDFSSKAMMKTFGSNNKKNDSASHEYNQFGEKMFSYFYARGNYEGVEKFGYDCADIFYWEHRMGMWGSAMLNEMDCAVYSLVGMNGRKLYEAALGLPVEERLSKKILARVVADYDETLAGIEYF